jgi:hypothetical protein
MPIVVLVTVAVKVTGFPKIDMGDDDATLTFAEALAMLCGRMDEADAWKFVSPLYSAVMLWFPAVRVFTISVAVLLLTGTETVPRLVSPFLKVTVPPGVPVVALATVAVKVTGLP